MILTHILFRGYNVHNDHVKNHIFSHISIFGCKCKYKIPYVLIKCDIFRRFACFLLDRKKTGVDLIKNRHSIE